MSVGVDRLVGAIGLAAFVAFAGATLPLRMLLIALGAAALLVLGVIALRRIRPDLMPTSPWPRPRQLAHGLVLSAGYQLSIAALLLGTISSTGHSLSPLELLGAFGASQIAGAVPGPNGAAPRDGALVVALVAMGVPWVAAAAAVTLKAALAWLPALLLGGASLLLTRRAVRRMAACPTEPAAAA
jgi:glycosyltransferase 2 family protein